MGQNPLYPQETWDSAAVDGHAAGPKTQNRTQMVNHKYPEMQEAKWKTTVANKF